MFLKIFSKMGMGVCHKLIICSILSYADIFGLNAQNLMKHEIKNSRDKNRLLFNFYSYFLQIVPKYHNLFKISHSDICYLYNNFFFNVRNSLVIVFQVFLCLKYMNYKYDDLFKIWDAYWWYLHKRQFRDVCDILQLL